ncbi:MAG: class I SAM-dependent methyltransferase [Treponema sp.]|jgi:ubiquinone/menaquinone biosynthesis C-methylase UbiE|nr:class I SAM-dependent methyltransferase [Treponema sp.]
MDEVRKEMRSRWNTDGWKYDSAEAHGIHDAGERTQWLDMLSPLPKETRILDVGTGTGFVALIAAEAGLRVTGLDWSETMLDQAKAKAAAQNLSVVFEQGTLENLPFAENSFDALTARHLLWTLLDPVEVFRQWFKVLKPEGRVFADYSPRKGSAHIGHHYREDIEEKLPLNRDVPASEIERLFREAGFSDISFISRKKEVKHGDHAHIHDVFIFTCVKK